MRKLLLCSTFILLFIYVSLSAQSKTDFFKQLDKWKIPENSSHPRLYFDSHGAEQLYQQYHSDSPRILTFLSECDSILARPVPDYSDYNASRYVARNESEKLSFAFVITREKKYADYARKIISQMIQWSDWVYDEHKPRTVDLGVAGVGYILALCYDWLYPMLTPVERVNIEETLIRQALIPFHQVYSTKSEGWTHAEHNWRSVICGEIGVVALALLEKAPNVKENLNFAIDGVADVLSHGGIDGGWNEGVSYWGYGIGQAIMFVEAMNNISNGSVDLFKLPFLAATGNFGLYTRTPAGDSFNFSDCNAGPPRPWIMSLFASQFQNPYWQWSSQKDVGSTIQDILFYDPNFTSKKPDTLTLGKHFRGIQVATMRSNWEKDAIFVGLKTGQSTANHSHLDLNSFILHAYGKPLLIDQHVWPYAHYLGFFEFKDRRWDFEGNHTIAHNTLLIDGQGQGYGERFQGRIINFKSSPELQFAIGEADNAYGDLLNTFRRYITLIDNKFVVIVDDIKADNFRQLEWLMHYEGQVSENPEGIFQIINENARLDVQFLHPAKQDNRVICFEQHETTYKATRTSTTQFNRFVSIRPLHRQQNYRFVVVAIPYQEGEKPRYLSQIISESEKDIKLKISINGFSTILVFDIDSYSIIRLE